MFKQFYSKVGYKSMNRDVVRRHFIRLILTGYRISFYKNILTIKRCKHYKKKINIDDSIRYLLDNKKDFKSFMSNEVETYRRSCVKNDGCFINTVLNEFRLEKDYLNILCIDIYNDTNIDLICIKKKFEFKKFLRSNDATFNKTIKDQNINIKKYFQEMEVYDGKDI